MIENPFRQYGKWEIFDDTHGVRHLACSMFQHSNGYFWIGCLGGLCRYDGRRFITYSHGDGVTGAILSLCESPSGDLWMTNEKGIIRYDGREFASYVIPAAEFPNTTAFSVLAEPDGSILCGSMNGGLLRFDGRTFRSYLKDKGLKASYVFGMIRSMDGSIWMGTDAGVYKYDGTKVTAYTTENGLPEAPVYIINQDAAGRIWCSSNANGFVVIDSNGVSILSEEHGLPDCSGRMAFQYRGGMFCVTRSSLCWFDGRRFVNTGRKPGPVSQYGSMVATDRDGGLWMGLLHTGVARYMGDQIVSLSDSEVLHAVTEDRKGGLWWGTNSGLMHRTPAGEAVDAGLHGTEVLALLADRNNFIWTGTHAGELFMRPASADAPDTRVPMPVMEEGDTGIRSIFEDRSGNIWVGVTHGICRVENGRCVRVVHGRLVSMIFQDAAGVIWFGGWSGGPLLGWDGNQWLQFPYQDKLPAETVTSMIQDRQGWYWVGTLSGLCHCGEGQAKTYDVDNGLPGNAIRRLMLDPGGLLWIATLGGGVGLFNGTDFQTITTADGLPSNAVTGLIRKDDGGVIIAGYGGICRYMPTMTPPLALIISVDADREYLAPGDITISTAVPAIHIKFSGISYGTKQLRYRCILEGYETEWRVCTKDTISYYGLKEGSYVFRVIAISRDLVRSEKPAEFRITVVEDPKDSRLDQLSRTVQEQTARLKAEREFMDHVMRAMTDAIILVSGAGVVKEANIAARIILGYAEGEMAGLDVERLFPAADRNRFRELVDAGFVRDTTVNLVTKNGSEIPVLLSSVVADDENREQAVICIIREASAGRGEDGKALLSSSHFSSALAKLEQAEQEMIKNERLRALGSMSSGVAHDFNNALVPILGYTEMLLRDPAIADKPAVVEMLKEVHQAAKDASLVVLNLRNFYTDSSVEQYDNVALNTLVEETIALTRPKWKEEMAAKGVTITVEASFSGKPVVRGNAAHLRIALTNLVFNSIEAMPDGGRITIRTREDTTFHTIEVVDSGLGMTEAVRKRCFEPFFTTRGKHGSGLGLSMVYGIIRRHGGQIEADSNPGRGTTMRIRLPAIAAAAKADAIPAGDTAVETASRQLRVLVIDDEESCRKILKSYLAVDNHSVVLASGGKEALEKFRPDKFDVVLTDRSMPDMSGDVVAASIKKMAPRIPVIMITGFGNVLVDEKNYPEGVDLVLGKPLLLDDLRRVLADLGRLTANRQDTTACS